MNPGDGQGKGCGLDQPVVRPDADVQDLTGLVWDEMQFNIVQHWSLGSIDLMTVEGCAAVIVDRAALSQAEDFFDGGVGPG